MGHCTADSFVQRLGAQPAGVCGIASVEGLQRGSAVPACVCYLYMMRGTKNRCNADSDLQLALLVSGAVTSRVDPNIAGPDIIRFGNRIYQCQSRVAFHG